MATTQQQAAPVIPEQEIVIPARILFALDWLDPDEQEAVHATLRELASRTAIEDNEQRLRRLSGDDPIYVVRAAPRVRLYVRLVPGGPVEALELVRPETLEKTFGVPDPLPDRA